MENKQIKSKDRVVDHGEVLTPSWLVNDMLDLIPADASKISSRYLENSSGEGAFLIEILNRKLKLIFETYNTLEDLEFYTVVGLTNIYGLELLKDNIEISHYRLRSLISEYFIHRYKLHIRPHFLEVVNHILDINVININSLTYEIPLFNKHELVRDEHDNILYAGLGCISEWEIDYRTREIQRIEYIYGDVVQEQHERFKHEQNLLNEEPKQLSLFDLTGEADLFVEEHNITAAKPIRVFEKTKFLNLHEAIIVKGR